MNYGQAIKEIREKYSLSQEYLAHELGVCFATLNRWERGKTIPSKMAIRAIKSFCEAHNLDFEFCDEMRGNRFEN